jgi:REP element-mobilizing transposase RayT
MSYIRLRYHIVTATKDHQPYLKGQVEHLARAMLVHSAKEQGAKLFQLGGIPNHVHLVAGLPAEIALDDFIQNIKSDSSRVINQEKLVKGGFNWAEGYAAVSLSPFELSEVIRYVAYQKYYHENNKLWHELEKLSPPGEPSYTRLRYHLVTATKYREPLIVGRVEDIIYRTFHKRAKKLNCVLLKMGGISDHVHSVAAIRPKISVSDFMNDVKKNSSRKVNNKHLLEGDFAWQKGYGAFTAWPFDLSLLLKYVINQKKHDKENNVWYDYEKG